MSVSITIFFFILGAMFGSFLNAWVYRAHRHLSIFKGRSFCPKCKGKIAWYDNIPIVSFLILRGKCRKCRKKISWQYPLVELAVGLAFVFALSQHGIVNYVELIRDCVILFFLIFIFVYDLKYQEILDATTLPIALLLFILGIVFRWHSWESLAFGLVLGAGFFLAQYLVSRGKWIGGGDIRLGLLIGVILGWPLTALALMLAYIAGAAVSIPFILAKKKKLASKVPFGTYLTLATFVTMYWGQGILDWYLGLLF